MTMTVLTKWWGAIVVTEVRPVDMQANARLLLKVGTDTVVLYSALIVNECMEVLEYPDTATCRLYEETGTLERGTTLRGS